MHHGRHLLRIPLSALLLMLLGCGDDGAGPPPASSGWSKYAGNPVLSAGMPGSWDAVGVGTPCVLLQDAGVHRMWYSGRDSTTSRIGLASSDDGTTWAKDPGNPVLGPGGAGTWEGLGVGDPCVFRDGARYGMYYTGRGPAGRSIGLAFSDDGVHWTRSETNPVLVPSPAGTSWDDREVLTPWVLRDGDAWHLWYTGHDGEGWTIGYASSSDGVTWTKLQRPVLAPQVLEALMLAPCVVESGAAYRMWYVALHETPAGGSFPGVIDYAQSVDRIEWTWNRLALSYGGAGAWDEHALWSVCVVDQEGAPRMWYEGQSAAGTRAVGFATLP